MGRVSLCYNIDTSQVPSVTKVCTGQTKGDSHATPSTQIACRGSGPRMYGIRYAPVEEEERTTTSGVRKEVSKSKIENPRTLEDFAVDIFIAIRPKRVVVT